MKYTALLTLFLLTFSFTVQAQHKVKERDLKGNWKMVIDIDEEYMEEEMDDEDIPWLGRIFAKSITGFVFNIIEEIDIEMQFMDNNRLKIVVEVFGEREVEYGRWYIDRNGALVLDDFENIHIGDDHENDGHDIWLMKNDLLVSYEKKQGQLERQPIYLKRLY